MKLTRYPGTVHLFVLWFALWSLVPRPLLAAPPDPPAPDVEAEETATPEEEKPNEAPKSGETQTDPTVPTEEAPVDTEERSVLRQAPALDPDEEPASPVTPTPSPPPTADAPAGSEPAAPSESRGDFMKRLLTPSPDKKEADRFELDYAPTQKRTDGEKTPIYKHWLLWTLVGVAAFAGTILIIQYTVDDSDKLTLDVTRRTP